MTAQPALPDPDDKDWTWVLDEPCRECGFSASTISTAQLPTLITDGVTRLANAARQPGSTVRPEPLTWSPTEYACHVRDVCRIFHERVTLMLGQDDPQFENWDQDATAVEDRYWAQDPEMVATELEAAGLRIAQVFASVPADAWPRPGRRSNGSRFTVQTLGLYFLHDIVHHVHDVAD
jgi:hypothetical protein